MEVHQKESSIFIILKFHEVFLKKRLVQILDAFSPGLVTSEVAIGGTVGPGLYREDCLQEKA